MGILCAPLRRRWSFRRTRLPAAVVTLALFSALAVAEAGEARAASLPPLPLGIPLPTNPTLGDLTSTATANGDGRGILPGTQACRSATVPAVSLPADDSPHNNSYFEWWWWDGHLITPSGRRLGFMVYFPSKPALGYYAVDYTITDPVTGRFHYGRQAYIRGAPPPAHDGMSLRGTNAEVVGGNGHDTIRMELDGYRLQLSIDAVKPPILQFGDGRLNFYCQTADFYSRPRMAIHGTLQLPGPYNHTVPVSGLGYFEHAWGFIPALDLANWDLINLQLRDGRDIYAAQLRDRPNGTEFTYDFGATSNPAGQVRTLHRNDFTLTPTAYWRRDSTCSYPVEYDLDVGRTHLHITPVLKQQELRATNDPLIFVLGTSSPPVYWDGEVLVTKQASPATIIGRGYLDMARFCHF
jgi:predicted secreted hydrolase